MEATEQAAKALQQIKEGVAFTKGNYTFKKTSKPGWFSLKHVSGRRMTISAKTLNFTIHNLFNPEFQNEPEMPQ